MGVWIETAMTSCTIQRNFVTPCMGVWIETVDQWMTSIAGESHPVWVCGLKPLALPKGTERLGHTLYGCVD